MANRTRAQLSTDSLTLFPNNTSQLITPQDLRDWLTNGIESFVTQKDISTFQNAFYESKSVDIVATSGTTNLALATGNYVHIIGTPPPPAINITSFGSLPRGSRFILCFDVPVTLVYNATTLKIPGSANITTAAGDCIMLICEEVGEWNVIGYFPGGGLPVGTITGVTAGTGLSGGGTGGVVTVNLANVSPDPSGSFTNADITVDAQGRITSASSGTSGGVTSVSGTSPIVSSGGTTPAISIQDAAADGSTKGASAFTASDFNSSSGVISIDYSNGQKASGSQDGFLSQTDWSTFNGKQNSLSLTTSGTSGAATLSGSTLNIPIYSSGGGGGTPGGSDTQIQYNNGGAFGGVNDLTWDDVNNVLTINNPRIGQSVGNGHFHMHNSTSGPSGIADYLTVNWEKLNRSIGFRYEQETFLSYLKFLQPTANRTYTLPDATGNVLLDTVLPTLNNGTSAGEIRLKEATANGNEYIAIKAPAAIATSATYSLTLPVSGPGSGQTIISDVSGNLSWVTPSSPSAKFISTNAVATVTGTTSETYLQQLLIPANTFSVGDGLGIIFRATRVVGTTTMIWKFYISDTSTVFAGKPQLSIVSYPNNVATSLQAQRNIFIAGATTSYFTFGSGVSRNTDFSGDNFSIANINWAADVYLVMTCTPGNTTASSTSVGISVCPT